jgi:hypothetical protein
MMRVFSNRLAKLEAERGSGQTRMIWTTVSDPNGGLRDMTEAELEAGGTRQRTDAHDLDDGLRSEWRAARHDGSGA